MQAAKVASVNDGLLARTSKLSEQPQVSHAGVLKVAPATIRVSQNIVGLAGELT